jgi:hypothetical protein
MKRTTTLALFVFVASLAKATLNYSEPDLDLTVTVAQSTLDAGDSFEVLPPPQLPQPDWLEPADATIIMYTFAGETEALWIELFHER